MVSVYVGFVYMPSACAAFGVCGGRVVTTAISNGYHGRLVRRFVVTVTSGRPLASDGAARRVERAAGGETREGESTIIVNFTARSPEAEPSIAHR